ncbi:hypothetical protein KQI82_12100 [Oscillibacter sp. MSJ-2]|uniref:Na+/H+ antiporter NhaC-like C-terminal domain-containing protein n=1 Tax=Dysosmobacter acutus TaxID=2841504 RepID=A0ABS6FC82_9FIRM|nr:Na+/H+ antiporter NhaC family protein [Dysosmobacter acutus]MBU5627650.1 hypothetical protein [Dysosmobacter acutus]
MAVCFLLFLTAVGACLVTGRPLLYAIFFGLVLFFAMGLKRGYCAKALWAMAWRKGKKALIVVQILICIGMLTAMWRSCGTIAFFSYYGVRAVTPSFFILIAFLLTTVLSLLLGSSFGVIGTAGIILMALARSGGVSVAVTAGAILSGSYFGDRCSPASSCLALISAVTGTEMRRNLQLTQRTVLVPLALTTAVYALLSYMHPIARVDGEILGALAGRFSLHWVVVVPALIMLVLPLCKVEIKLTMVLSIVSAAVITVALQGMGAGEMLRTLVLGYDPADPLLARVLHGGGLFSMASSMGMIFITSLYSGILEGANLLEPVRHHVDSLADRIGLYLTTALVSVASVFIFCNQSVMVFMDEQLLRQTYRRKDNSPTDLAIDIANTGVVLAELVPWSISLTIPLAMLGAGLSAAPYAVLHYVLPLCYYFTRPHFHEQISRKERLA